MRTGTRAILAAILTLSVCYASAQQSKWPSTFLWKISGKGLKKASWLYGTIHLQDKRLFNFGDSLYHALESAEGFAMEVDLQEFLDSMIQRGLVNASLDDEEEAETDAPKEDVVKVTDELSKEERKKIKERVQARRQQLVNQLKYGEMPTIMDAYLYGIARRTGKWLGAVEDVSDQLVLYDEFGGALDDDDIKASDGEVKLTLDKLIKIYLAKDLQGIDDQYMLSVSSDFKDKLLVKRNYKMASSMESQSALRSMFFAVGAAHLPGPEGVINLLRKKGYTITPVFSAVEMPAEKYAAKLATMPWVKLTEQVDSAYSVEMPGKATDINAYGDLVKMKMHFDITTMTVYMTGHALAQVKEDYLPNLIDDYAKNVNAYGKPQDVKNFTRNGVKGQEAILHSPSGYFRVQLFIANNLLYMAVVGSEKKIRVLTADVDRFFNSYTILDRKAKAAKGWESFTIDGKAFKVDLPGKPKMNKNLQAGASQGGWNSSVYDLMDAQNGLYFLVQTRDLEAGYHLDGDTSWFGSFKENLNINSFQVDSMDTWQGYPRLQLAGETEDRDAYLQILVLLRGSRVYALMAVSSSKSLGADARAQFFSSFQLTDYKPGKMELRTSPDKNFSSQATASIEYKVENDPDVAAAVALDPDKDAKKTYVAYDPADAVSFVIQKEALSPYTWYASDSAFFAKQSGLYKGWEDSIYAYKETTNGKLIARDYVFLSPDNHNLKKVRLVLNGDTLYTIYSFIPQQLIGDKRYNAFFDEFRVSREVGAQTIFTNRSDRLKQAMLSNDSATFAKATVAFQEITFTKKELPFLHDALTRVYQDDSSEYYTLQDRIIGQLDDLEDPSTVAFIREQYGKIPATQGKVKMGMISTLAGIQTQDSYDLLHQLLVKDPPANTKGIYVGYKLTDSMELAQTLFPDLLTLLKHPAWVDQMTAVCVQMLDSARLTVAMLEPYLPAILHYADTTLASATRAKEEDPDSFGGYQYQDLVNLLGYMNQADCQQRLRSWIAIGDLQLQYDAALALTRNGQKVEPAVFEKLAASNEFRVSLYNELTKLDKASLFPAKYKSQRYMAESEMYTYSSDDYSPSEMIFIGERKAEYKGTLSRFYLFAVVFGGEEGEDGEPTEKTTYFAVAGPYSMNDKEVISKEALNWLHWDEEYDKKKTDEWFRMVLKQMAESEEE